MYKIFTSIILLLSLVTIMDAQSNQRIEFEELGLSFRVPSGWTGGVKEEFYLLGHNSIPGLMILTENKSVNASELKRVALQGLSTDGIQLSPKGELKIKGNDRVEGYYEGVFQGSNARVFAIGLINKLGSGINVFIVTEKGKFTERHAQEAKKLARSVKFFKRRDSRQTTYWKQRLIGRKLKYMKVRTNNNQYDGSFSGTSDSVSILLYQDGTFSYYSSASASYGGPGGTGGSGMYASGDRNKGEFNIYTIKKQTFLDLYFPNQTRTYKLMRNEKGHTLLNGSRYSVVGMN